MSETQPSLRLGPNRWFAVWCLVWNPLFALAAVVFAFQHWPAFTIAVATPFGSRSPWFHECHRLFLWLQGLPVPAWFAFLIGGALYAWVRAGTTHYTMSDVALDVDTGLLCWPAVLSRYTNTIAHTTITDCDLRRNLLQSLLGSGTLIVSYVEGDARRRIFLHWISDAQTAHRHIVDRAGVMDARMVVR